MEATQCMPSLLQEIRIKKLSKAGKLTENEVEGINQPGIWGVGWNGVFTGNIELSAIEVSLVNVMSREQILRAIVAFGSTGR